MAGKVLFITGASSGIGAQTARDAAKAGWSVALFARSEEKLKTLAGEIGDAALAVPGDVTDLPALEGAIAKTVEAFGSVNAVFANAGTGLNTPGIENGDPEEWSKLIDINIKGVLLTLKASYAELKKAKGHLVLTGSVAGRVHIPASVYGASKWFVHGLAGNMTTDMREWGGRCTVIAPGMVDTPFFSDAKPDKLKPEDVAKAVVYALEQPSHANVQEVVIMPTG
jgi:NADP-dependent 3-hydroxy acid dehydrogenase YdfG